MASFLWKYSQFLAAGGICTVFSASLYPQTLGLSNYRAVLANYKDGVEQPVDPPNRALIDRVLERIKLVPADEAGLQFFTCFGNDPVHRGSAFLRSGAIVGLPPTYSYKSPSDIEESLRAGGHVVDWTSPAGIRLSEAMVLSDKAKAFVIAREIHYTATYHIYVDAALKGTFLGLSYTGGFMMNRLMHLRQRMRLWARGGVYGLIGGFGYIMYTALADTYYCFRDNSVDRRTARLGWAYAEGGVEFYNKALARNVALREIMGEEGKKTFTAYGNDTSTIRRSYVQLTERRDNLVKSFDQYQEKERQAQAKAAS